MSVSGAASRHRTGKRCFAVLVLFAVALLAGVDGVIFIKANAAPIEASGDAEAEFDAAFEALKREPRNPKLIWRYVRAARAVGNYEAAIGVLEPILLLDANQPVIRSEIGLLYYQLGSYSAAEQHLKASLKIGGMSEERTRLVRRVLDFAERRNKVNRFDGSIAFGLRYQSNPTALPDEQTITFAGNDITLRDRFAKEADGNAFVSAWIQHKLDFGLQNELKLETWASFYATRQFTATETNVIAATLEPGFSWRPFRHSAGWLAIRPHLHGNILSIEDDLYAATYGGGLNAMANFQNGVSADFTYQFRQRDFNSTSRHPSADEFDGHENHYRLSVTYPLPGNMAVNTRAYAIRSHTDAAGQENWNVMLSAKLLKDYRGLFDIGSTYWRAWFQVDREFHDYLKFNPLLSTSRKREDDRWILSAGNSANITQNLDLNLLYSWYDQDSNFNQYKYVNHSGVVSVSYSF